jgi:hypothetical protein
MRRLPHQGARHSTVDHGDTSNGVFLLLHLWVLPSSRVILLVNDLPPLLSLACGRPLGRMALSLCEWRRLHVLRVEGSSRSRKGGRTDPRVGQAGRPRPILTRFGCPFAPGGPYVFMHFAPSICTILTMSSSRPRWRFSFHEVRSFTLQSSGMFLCNTSFLATFGSDFIKLSNTNETPQLLLWTCSDSVLYVHVFLQKHNTSKCTYKDEHVISLVCLLAG